VVVLLAWFEIQKGVLNGEVIRETPQEFSRVGSVIVASPEMSETRSV
jgi:hypothetical protein